MNRTEQNMVNQLFSFIEKCPTTFHVVDTTRRTLLDQGYTELQENQNWKIENGGHYFVTRNLSSLISFKIPEASFHGFHITASHSDSPTFRIKENAEIEAENHYTKLNVEKYGGMLMAPWFDRPLSAAGRVILKQGDKVVTRLVNVDRDLVVIPNLAIHMNRQANEGYKYNPQTDMIPLFGDAGSKNTFPGIIAEAAQAEPGEIIGSDLYLYNRMAGTVWGADREYISAPRLDDLQCVFSSLYAFLLSHPCDSAAVHCVLDSEEVGSSTRQGAASTFLKDTLKRICSCFWMDTGDYYTSLSQSFMLSADNAHAVHPNHLQKSDPTNRPRMNKGVVIKFNGNQKYTTDGMSAAIFKTICENNRIPYQTYFNRSDIAGGSTLGNISNNQVPLAAVDIGLAQLAMHSPYETAGAKDTGFMADAIQAFFDCSIRCLADGSYILK